jgi:hypothetical protein
MRVTVILFRMRDLGKDYRKERGERRYRRRDLAF